MPTELHELFSEQIGYLFKQPYKNEFETMSMILEKIPKKIRANVQKLSLQWLENLERNEYIEFDMKEASEKVKEAKELRQKGNQLFTGKGKNRNILEACRFYNDAIDAALDADNGELALGFANRGMALQTFGYYQQAYDDCVWALRLGYPDSMRHKIILRQAFTSIKLENVEKAEKHLGELKQLELNSNCLKQFEELEESLVKLKRENEERKENSKKEDEIIPLNRESQEIIITEKGRSMIAKCDIEKNQLIFTERISAAVTTSRRICQQCLTVNFIPYPCIHCRGRVNYCSIKCQEEHANIHAYECRAYRFQLFSHVGIAHLALRVVLDNGIFSIVDKIKNSNKSTAQIWYDLLDSGDISDDNSISNYAESLRMMTHLDKMSELDIMWFALVAHLLVMYLKHYTGYFEKLKEKSDTINWEILTGSLILRHIGQSISNGHTFMTVIPKSLNASSNTEYHMLNDKIWSSPWHLKLGNLNNFCDCQTMASINVPYKSLCNHSCVQSYQCKFSGRYVSTYALRNFRKGDEITNCYAVDYRKFKRSARRERLKETYHFDCNCEDCQKVETEDLEFNKYHQYRCDNSKCGKIFVPNIPENPNLNWWQTETPNGTLNLNIYCTVCGSLQTLSWCHEFVRLMYTDLGPNIRRRQYQIFKSLENTLIGLNDARGYIALELAFNWLKLPLGNNNLNDQDYVELIEMVKYLLELHKAECGEFSLEYVVVLTFLWDLMALCKYRCSKASMDKMLLAINILPDDTKVIFLNYYDDYIKKFYI